MDNQGFSEDDNLFEISDEENQKWDLWRSGAARMRLVSHNLRLSVASAGSNFNHAVGFRKLPPSLGDPLYRRKIYVMVFEVTGLILGFVILYVALHVKFSETFQLIAEENDMHDLEIDKLFRYNY